MSKKWIPEIVYQEGSQIPFIEVPAEEEMPNKLFMFEYKQTGEFEPGPSGEDVPICDMEVHMYFNYNYAKKVLDKDLLNKLRKAFGLEEYDKAMEKGKKITEKVTNKE